MIEPMEISLSEFNDYLRSEIKGVMFFSLEEKKYFLYDGKRCIFELLIGTAPYGHFLNSKNDYEWIPDFFYFLEAIRGRYPDVADWFLFNIKKFT